MAADHLTPEARRENAAALAEALGIHVTEAAKALELLIVVTADPDDRVAQRISQEVVALLSRTVQSVSTSADSGVAAAELVIGASAPRTEAAVIRVQVNADQAVIGRNVHSMACADVPSILCLLTACYASAAALYYALGGRLPSGLADPLVVDFIQLGIDPDSNERPVDVGHAYLAGAGAIGNGFLWAARHLDIRGRLEIVDDDKVTSGNLNRQVWFESGDIDSPKAECLTRKAQPFFPRLTLIPRYCRLQDLPEKSDGPWLRRLIVAVDSRRARRSLQNEMPGEVFDASTTDIREVVLHHHSQPTDTACLSCIYEPDNEELTREQHIADHLGVSVAMVRAERISAAAAETISRRYPTLDAAQLVGSAYDTLFKRLCAEGQLQTLAGRQVIAPFAFVSVLAGTMLALELVRWLGDAKNFRDYNYWRISAWHPPLAGRRVLRPRQPGCAFCGNAVLRKVNAAIWSASPGESDE
ncbi:MAG: ThiF family adenylyltransferase [Acidiferrobacterales bacterium]